MDFTKMTVEELEARRVQIGEEVEKDGADLDALEAEIKGIKAELDARKENAAKQAEIRKAVADGEGVVVEEFEIPKQEEERTMFKVDSIEYRNAWVKKIIGRELNEEERAALGAAAAVIPTMTVNDVWNKLINPAVPIGYSTIASLLALGFGVTNISLGILAEYLWRTYDAARARPPYIVSEAERLDLEEKEEQLRDELTESGRKGG
jgi:hypothetical protein